MPDKTLKLEDDCKNSATHRRESETVKKQP